MNWDRLPFIHRSARFLKPESRASCVLTIAIRPEKGRETNWTKVSIDVPRPGPEFRQTDTKVLLTLGLERCMLFMAVVPSRGRSIIRRGIHREEDCGTNFPWRFRARRPWVPPVRFSTAMTKRTRGSPLYKGRV